MLRFGLKGNFGMMRFVRGFARKRYIYREQQLRKENPLSVRHSEEEKMKKRFIRNREEAKFTAKAERQWKKHRKLLILKFMCFMFCLGI